MTSRAWRAIAVQSRAWHWSSPKQSFPEPEIFFDRPSQVGRAYQPGLGQQLSAGHPAVVEGQLPGPQVAAGQQVVARAGGGEPRPGIPALALGAVASGAGFPTPGCFSSALIACARVSLVLL
jgi:hypothetical protein